jgi:hypothetical protein
VNATAAISRATIQTLSRQKLLIVPIIGLVLSLLALGATLLLADGSVDFDDESAEAAAWAAGAGAAIASTIYGVIVGSSLIAREISDGTLLMLAVRPIARWQIMAGRVLGATLFVVGALLLSCLVYGIVAMLTAGMIAPIDEPIEAALYGIPAVLLAVAMGAAFSVQGRATAAIGSAIAVGIFATVITPYAREWSMRQELRSHLSPEVQQRYDQVNDNDAIVGPAAVFVVRLLPFGVFMSHAAIQFDSSFDGESPGEPDSIDPVTQPNYNYVMPEPAQLTDPPAAATATPAEDPAAGVSLERRKLPPDPTDEAFDCSSWAGPECFYGFRNAWKDRRFDAPAELHEDGGLLLAWLAIPLWVVIGAGLLMRRRDLVAAN